MILMFSLVRIVLDQPVGGEERSAYITVVHGTTGARIAESLKKQHIIDTTIGFKLALKITGTAKHIQTGVYYFSTSMRPSAMVRMLRKGSISTIPLTVRPGDWLNDVANNVAQLGIISSDDFIAACRDQSLLHEYGINASTAEGYLYPDTYYLNRDTTAETLVRRLLDHFFTVVNESMRAHFHANGLSLHQAVTLASIVESEVRKEHSYERPLVAGVYLNRLHRNMKLQADPTVLYSLGYHKDRVLLVDLKNKSPYNTYKHKGLPPGPICSPSEYSLKAVAFPAHTDYIYFVAIPYQTRIGAQRSWLPAGSHYFSATYTEHRIAQRRYMYGEEVFF